MASWLVDGCCCCCSCCRYGGVDAVEMLVLDVVTVIFSSRCRCRPAVDAKRYSFSRLVLYSVEEPVADKAESRASSTLKTWWTGMGALRPARRSYM